MTRRTNILAVALGLAVMWSATGPVLAHPLPHEPGEERLVNEDVDIGVGFYFREYSLAQNGIIDYRTARQILSSEYDKHKKPVVQAKKFPLFYWYDEDQDGQFEMWIDRKVEGCLCDIVRYHLESSQR